MNTEWLCTLEATYRYKVGPDMLKQWRRWRDFPEGAVKAGGRTLLWHTPAIDKWLRQRKLSHFGRPPRWAMLVGNPDARELQVGR
jgi:hypothetical protein